MIIATILSKLVDTIKNTVSTPKNSPNQQTSPDTNTTNSTHTTHTSSTEESTDSTINLQKTFSSEHIDVSQIIKDILDLHKEFPNNILYSKDGHKYNELEFFQSNLDSNVNSKNASLFDKFNRTSTQLGKTLLQSILLQPTTDIENILKYRQQQATLFSKHHNLKEIRTILTECSKLEKDILAMQMQDTPEMQEVYKVIFFEFMALKKLNYNETFLKLFYYFIILFSPAYGAIAPVIFMFAPYIFMRYVLKVPLPFETFWMILKKMILGGTGFFTNLHKIINSDIGKVAESMVGGGDGSTASSSFSFKNIIITIIKWVVAFMNTSAGTYVYLGFILFSYLYGIYNTIQSSITYNKIINMFHSRLNIISKWLKGAVRCYKMGLGIESPEITHCFIEMKALLQNQTIINLLNHTCFDCEPGILSNKGMIIKSFKEFLDLKAMIQPFCKYMAHIDVWCSVGKWLEEGQVGVGAGAGTSGAGAGAGVSTRNICSFITHSKTPIVKGSAVWNICCDTPIYNDVKLGYEKEQKKEKTEKTDKTDTGSGLDSGVDSGTEDSPVETEKEKEKNNKIETFNNLLITGPNGSGKSTYIKSVIECILLGQTIGVVPAKEFSFTPFVNIATYLNIPDCQGKESLFQAEMNRCYQQLQMLNNAEEKGDFSFNIMDEIFVSTNYQEGMSGAYAIIKKMCNLNKCLNIITTHFDVLAGMDEVKVDKQYFDIQIDENDSIISDYKIKSGVSKKHLALKLLKKKGFDASIIADAEYLYEKLQGFDKKEEKKIEEVIEVRVKDEVKEIEKIDEVDEVKEVKKLVKVEDVVLEDEKVVLEEKKVIETEEIKI